MVICLKSVAPAGSQFEQQYGGGSVQSYRLYYDPEAVGSVPCHL